MPVKIRLARHGRKARPIYHIVVADSRAPRDGKFIQKLGLYNPNTNPATIDLDFEGALDWLQKGAQPTDTCRALLSKRGVLMKKHLLEGAKKGAFSEDEANKRFDAWLSDKEMKARNEIDKIEKAKESEAKEQLEREAKVNEERAAVLAKKRAEEKAKASAGEASEESESGEEVAEATSEAGETPESVAPETVEAPATPAAEEPKAEESAPATENTAETEAPAEEDKKKEE
jgi:small subunit ribosomal protein S16